MNALRRAWWRGYIEGAVVGVIVANAGAISAWLGALFWRVVGS